MCVCVCAHARARVSVICCKWFSLCVSVSLVVARSRALLQTCSGSAGLSTFTSRVSYCVTCWLVFLVVVLWLAGKWLG